ncbi:TIGR04211 family SH3 domain-containing protein [Aliamphritea spongicola]|nr:TIGR04211 family SH3 domain-containing protein [Aliamphritea spongicola]
MSYGVTMRLLIASCFTLVSLFSLNTQAAYISDDVFTYYHGGPSDQYRITGRIRSGTSITILDRNKDSGYVKIKTASGRTGWLPGANVSEGSSMSVRFPQLEEKLGKSNAMITQQNEVIQSLKQQTVGLQQQNKEYADTIAKLELEISSLNRSINSMDDSNLMRWFTYGGLVAFGGLVLGLIIPLIPRRKKRPDVW